MGNINEVEHMYHNKRPQGHLGAASPPININPEKDSAEKFIGSLQQCLAILENLKQFDIIILRDGRMCTNGADIVVTERRWKGNVTEDKERLDIHQTFRDIVQNRKALCTIIQLLLTQWQGIVSSETKQTPINVQTILGTTYSLDYVYDKAEGMSKENNSLKRKMQHDTRQILIDELLTPLKMKQHIKEDELIHHLICRNAELIDRLAAEMNEKVAASESSLENIGIPNRPMTVAEEFSLLNSNGWLNAKTALDQELPDENQEANKVQALCKILMEAEQQSKLLYEHTMDTLYEYLKDPAHAELSDYGQQKLSQSRQGKPNEKRSVLVSSSKTGGKTTEAQESKLPSNVTTAIGDFFRTTADYVKLEVLYENVTRALRENDETGKGTLVKLLDEHDVMDYLKQCSRLCWKMAIQRPPMYFDTSGIGKAWRDNNYLDIAWNSDPRKKGAAVRYYKYPSLFHGRNLMVKGSVFVN